jgi:hypothetical protein
MLKQRILLKSGISHNPKTPFEKQRLKAPCMHERSKNGLAYVHVERCR